MSSRVIAAVPVSTDKMVVWLEGGRSVALQARDAGIEEDFAAFAIGPEGGSLVWDDGKVLSVDELLERAEEVDVVYREKMQLLRSLSRMRRDASFSQTRLGEAAGIRQSVISRIEGCEISPQINTLLKLLCPLGKTLAIVDLEE